MPTSAAREPGQIIPLHYHYHMLTDTRRMSAFQSAIEMTVMPGSVVADLGSGTGVLAFFAARRGARVYAVEADPALAEASRQFLAANGVADRVTVIEGDAEHWLSPEPVDVVTCEMLHSALLRERQVQVMTGFRDRHLQRFGHAPRLLPEATLLAVQPMRQRYDFHGYRATVPLFQDHYLAAPDCLPCGEPALYATVDYQALHSLDLGTSQLPLLVTLDGEINALRFVTKHLLALDERLGRSIDWYSQNLILPLDFPRQIRAGTTVHLSFRYQPGAPLEALWKGLSLQLP